MKAVDPTLLAVSLMQQCLNGFTSEHHHGAWRKKWWRDIDALPAALKRAVLFAWEQATARVDDGTTAADHIGEAAKTDEPF